MPLTSSPSSRNAFVAGAGGAIGEMLCQLLNEDGWRVVGTTRSLEKAARLQEIGVIPAVIDVFNREAFSQAMRSAEPNVVVHQLTDLPKHFSSESMAASRSGNARIREVGTSILVSAAIEAGAKRIVAQSIAFAYAAGPVPHAEGAPLDSLAHPAVIKLEEIVLGSDIESIVLRYGRPYGPKTWTSIPPSQAPLHVDAAADAARRAMTVGRTGVYNIAEDDGTVTSAKARNELGWNPEFRSARPAGARG